MCETSILRYAVFLNERRVRHWWKSWTITNKQGVMKSTWIVELTMPPILGAAMGFMISIPGPVEKGISDNESTMVATVINLGRKRFTEPSTTASMNDCSPVLLASASRMKATMSTPV